MSLTKASLIESIVKENSLTKTHAAKMIDTVFDIIKRELEKGEDVLISRFGKFCIRNKSQRRGRNPRTGEDMILPSRKVVRFQCSTVLKGKLNDGNVGALSRPQKKRKPV